MSLSSSGFDRAAAEDVATDLNVSAGMVEKEWHAVRVAVVALSCGHGDPWHGVAFGGGTSLSSAYDLIQRFSEDVDIRLFSHRGRPSASVADLFAFCDRLTATLAPLGYVLDQSESEDFVKHSSSRRAYRFAATFAAVEPVRPFVKVDISIAACVRPTLSMQIQSRLDRALGQTAGSGICVCPLETAADKLSALAWRVHDGRAIKEPHTMRHLYDVHVLAERVDAELGRFRDLVLTNLSRDVSRIQTVRRSKGQIGRDTLKGLPGALKGTAAYRHNYDRFARAFAFGPRPDFELARATVDALVGKVCR